ncbi:MAG TPA: RICIN domain-containing protein [Polyangiaceae bacterium]|jgi:hypothetical protein
MRKNFLLELVLLAAVAAGGPGCVGASDAVGEQQSVVSGGKLAGAAEFPFSVRFNFGCSGSKIGPRRFLTAAHCVDDFELEDGDSFNVTNFNSGFVAGAVTYKLTADHVYIHPSWDAAPRFIASNGQPDREQQRVYDLAIIDADADSATIPTVPNRWELLGVMSHYVKGSTTTGGDQFLWGARLSNVWRWIANPGVSDFRDGAVGYLMNRNSGKCADLANGNLGNEAGLAQYPCEDDHSATQRLRVVHPAGVAWFQLVDEGSGRCLSARSPGSGDGIAQFDCNDADTLQQFTFAVVNDPLSPVTLRNRGKNACVAIPNGSVDDAAPLAIEACGATTNQHWIFTR